MRNARTRNRGENRSEWRKRLFGLVLLVALLGAPAVPGQDAVEPSAEPPAAEDEETAAPTPAVESEEEEAEAPSAPDAPAAEPAAESPVEQAPVQTPPTPFEGGILLNFQDASVDAVLSYLSEAAGFVIVKAATVTGRVSLVSRQPVTADEAVALLNTVLKDKNCAAIRMGRALKIVPLADAKKANIPVRWGNDPAAIEPTDEVVTQVIPLRYVDAARLRQDIAALIPTYADLSSNVSSNALILTDTQANVRRIVEIVRALDTTLSAVTEVRVFQLKYANATGAARLITEIFSEDAQGQQQAGGFGAFVRRFRGPGGDQQPADAEGRPAQKATASADD